MKFMKNVIPQNHNWFIRTILNFIRYHMLIRQIYYKDKDRETLAELMRNTADHGFNRGVEFFWTKYESNHILKRFNTKKELKRMANDIKFELEDIQNAKIKEQKMKEKQEKIKKENEERKRPKYEEGYRPTVEELLNRKITLTEMKNENISYKFYDIREKGAYAALILVEGGKPFIFYGPEYKKVREVSFKKWLDLTKGMPIKPFKAPTPPKKAKVKKEKDDDFDIDISHVEKAMGINSNNRMNSNQDDDLDDILDGLF